MSTAPTTPAAPRAAPPRRRRWPWLLLALPLLLLGGALGGAAWLLKTEAGARWALAQAPGVQASGVSGALLGPDLRIEQLVVRWDPQGVATIDELSAQGLHWSWRPLVGAWAGLRIDQLRAARVVVRTGPPAAEPTPRPQLPQSLRLPVQLQIDSLQLPELQVDEQPPVRGLQARLRIGAEHRIDDLALSWDRVRLSDGSLRIAADPPFALQAALRATSTDEAVPYTAALRADGTLEKLALDAQLRGSAAAGPGRPAPAFDLHAEVAPFRPWPLLMLNAKTEALDLATLASALPHTRLDGRVDVQTRGLDAPVGVTVDLRNGAAGRWDAGRLPLLRAQLTLSAELGKPERIALPSFDITFAGGGRWRGRGEWLDSVLKLQTRLEEVEPRQLHAAAPVMQLSGPLDATLRGLPRPPLAPAAAGAPAFDPAALSAELSGELSGTVEGAPQAVQIAFDGTGSATRLALRKLLAQSGNASARLTLDAERQQGAWGLRGEIDLQRFDPLRWWPSAPPALRRGPHRLNAEGRFDLRLPADAQTLQPQALLARTGGSARLQLKDSLLAGVPLQASVELGRDGTPAAATRVRGDAVLGANRVAVEGRLDAFGDGSSDRLHAEIEAPNVATLTPLLQLVPGTEDWLPRRGRVEATLDAEGRWPALRSRGEVKAANVQAGALALGSLQGQWRFGGAEQPLQAQLQAAAVQLGERRVESLRAEVDGTLARHRIDLRATLPLAPPTALADLLGQKDRAGLRAQLQGEGRWQPAAAGGGRWRAELERLALGGWDGKPATAQAAPGGSEWLLARALRAEVVLGPQGQLQRASVEPGRVVLGDTIALAWQRAEYDATQPRPAFALSAQVESFAVAPLLARAQPTFGWGGDLKVKAQIELRAAQRIDADIVVERAGGDLQLGFEGAAALPLGLSDLRLGLAVHDGQWVATQALAGRNLGEVSGAVRVRTAPDALVPPANAPLDGVLQARVANLATLGIWVPPGWRLTGSARSSATIGGTFGAPQYSGEIVGNAIGVRNPLLGVDIRNGEVEVALQGDTATIRTFRLQGGDGTLQVAGGATFGATPELKLQLQADKLRVLGRIDRKVVASGAAQLTLRAQLLQLDGDFKIDEGLFDVSRADAPSLDDDVVVRRNGSEPQAPVEPPPPGREMRVAIGLDLGENLRVRGRGLDAFLRGQLKISTPGGRLAINGTVRTFEGTYKAYGQNLVIERGVIAFNGPPDLPRLDILALRKTREDTRVGVLVSGTVMNPRARLYSEPEMSDTEKLSWLVLGRAPSTLGRADTALLQSAALGLLAGEGEGKSETLVRQLGLDELSLRQSNGEVRETVIAVGKQISKDLYVGYERGLNTATGTWQLIYRIANRFTVRAQAGSDSALDLIWTWRIDKPRPKEAPR